MSSGVVYEVPTWSQIYDMLLSEALRISSRRYQPDVVVGVARGGLVAARILTDLLEVPAFATMQVQFYVDIGQTLREPVLKHTLCGDIVGKKVLLVDDIADSGRSLQLAIRYLQSQGAAEVKTATLYFKPQSVAVPDFYEKETSSWVIFPWDTKETLRKIIQKKTGKRQLTQEIAKLVKAGLPKKLADTLLKDMQQAPRQ